MPWLAQRFPKDITFGPNGARAAFWSGRSGREFDFRTPTLIDEYWQSWANYSPEGSRWHKCPATHRALRARTISGCCRERSRAIRIWLRRARKRRRSPLSCWPIQRG
jgi:hypothetical protein